MDEIKLPAWNTALFADEKLHFSLETQGSGLPGDSHANHNNILAVTDLCCMTIVQTGEKYDVTRFYFDEITSLEEIFPLHLKLKTARQAVHIRLSDRYDPTHVKEELLPAIKALLAAASRARVGFLVRKLKAKGYFSPKFLLRVVLGMLLLAGLTAGSLIFVKYDKATPSAAQGKPVAPVGATTADKATHDGEKPPPVIPSSPGGSDALNPMGKMAGAVIGTVATTVMSQMDPATMGKLMQGMAAQLSATPAGNGPALNPAQMLAALPAHSGPIDISQFRSVETKPGEFDLSQLANSMGTQSAQGMDLHKMASFLDPARTSLPGQANTSAKPEQAHSSSRMSFSRNDSPGRSHAPMQGILPGQGVPNYLNISPELNNLSGQDVQPGQGIQPGQGMQPGQGIQPGQGVQPGQGMQPGQGVQPGQGMQPGQGVQPGQGIQPGQGVQPGQGIQPDPSIQTGQSIQQNSPAPTLPDSSTGKNLSRLPVIPLDAYRQQYPGLYEHVTDWNLATGLYRRYYHAHMSRESYFRQLGLDPKNPEGHFVSLSDYRARYPGNYDDLTDIELAEGLRQKYFANTPPEDFHARIGLEDPQDLFVIRDREARLQEARELLAAGETQRAYRMFLRLAQQGSAVAQASLGYLLTQGLGTLIHKQRAILWYRKAADQGNSDARHNLDLLLAAEHMN
ncbi:MAG: hypothetical protein H7833_01155 [Magnetococcus sp. DMHC-1]|nr:hypothetical protein [Magnetococcales bacterium]